VPKALSILFIGDVVGHIGHRELLRTLPALKQQYLPDVVIVNGENIVDGKGLSEKEALELFAAGVHAITTGNHIWENWKARPLLASQHPVIRPLNYPSENPGKGYCFVPLPSGKPLAVLQLQGRTFMQPIDCPFKAADWALARIGPQTNLVFVDFHAEVTAEKVAMGWHLDGRVSAVIGTHTHIQTNDARLLPRGTAYLTDSGMTGPYDSVLGMKKDIALKRFMLQTAHKYEVAEGDVRVSGVHLLLDESTGKATSIHAFSIPEPVRSVSSV
jgi:metallophosphoesterase (TIGR00282 family)